MANCNGHPRAKLYLAERAKGLTHREIAEKYGVSCQAVSQACAKYDPSHFKPYTAKEVVYPHLRKWLNDNKVSRKEFGRRLGIVPYGEWSSRISFWFRGEGYPSKNTIDRMLAVTGLTYEKLWERGEEDAAD